MERKEQSRGAQPDVDRESVAHDDPSGTDYSSRQTDNGTQGFTGGGNVGRREEFHGRENVTEERMDMAVDADEPLDEPLGDDNR